MADEGHELQRQRCDCRAWADTPVDSTQLSTQNDFIPSGVKVGCRGFGQMKVGN